MFQIRCSLDLFIRVVGTDQVLRNQIMQMSEPSHPSMLLTVWPHSRLISSHKHKTPLTPTQEKCKAMFLKVVLQLGKAFPQNSESYMLSKIYRIMRQNNALLLT